MKVAFRIGAAGVLAIALTACGGHPSAVAPTGQTSASVAPQAAPSGGQASSGVQVATVAPLVNGKPMWAPNRQHTAEENAQYQFTKNGGDLGAASEADYVTKVHAFVDSPPVGAETLDRSNGDRLIYDPKGNVFAVVSKDGAPRTMFKPRDGAAYWAQQKQNQARRAAGAARGSGQEDS